MSTMATNYFNALFNHPEVTGVVITPTYTTTGGAQLVLKRRAYQKLTAPDT